MIVVSVLQKLDAVLHVIGLTQGELTGIQQDRHKYVHGQNVFARGMIVFKVPAKANVDTLTIIFRVTCTEYLLCTAIPHHEDDGIRYCNVY